MSIKNPVHITSWPLAKIKCKNLYMNAYSTSIHNTKKWKQPKCLSTDE